LKWITPDEVDTNCKFDFMRLPGNVSCFLKPDGLVLSMPAIHTTGSDHFEAQLRYEEIQSFYRLKRNYWEK